MRERRIFGPGDMALFQRTQGERLPNHHGPGVHVFASMGKPHEVEPGSEVASLLQLHRMPARLERLPTPTHDAPPLKVEHLEKGWSSFLQRE
jgi:hypothetical protein